MSMSFKSKRELKRLREQVKSWRSVCANKEATVDC